MQELGLSLEESRAQLGFLQLHNWIDNRCSRSACPRLSALWRFRRAHGGPHAAPLRGPAPPRSTPPPRRFSVSLSFPMHLTDRSASTSSPGPASPAAQAPLSGKTPSLFTLPAPLAV